MFKELEFQTKVFSALEYHLEQLVDKKAKVKKIAKVADELGITPTDFTEEAWKVMKAAGRLPASRLNIPFSPRKDSLGRPVPNATFKVPTGGGKTWLAVKSASMILNKYLGQNTGFILWIVPNEAIYSQTLKNFKDRTHPYRQAFDRAAAGRVKILTKNDRLNAVDVETHLCVMVLMLQSSNRQNKDALRMFRDRGDVHGFIPPDGEQDKHVQMLMDTGNLDHYGGGLSTMIKSSLGNALRLIRPVVVMDEGHRAVSELAYETLYGFNPSFVLELTATPKDIQPRGGQRPIDARYANLLVEVTGKELDREDMIKFPMILDPHQASDWQSVLNASIERLNSLQDAATTYQSESNRYIRPILLVQVERTGKDTRDGTHIHAEDVREYLTQTGIDEAEIAIKTAEQNDLKQPENQDLLSPYNRIRVIITKEALQEGWDCPFAYVLCSLAARTNHSAMKQLVGRILRQPEAEKTSVEALDRCYVFTHKAVTNNVIKQIKEGLQVDGLGDLVLEVSTENTATTGTSPSKVKRRQEFRNTQIFLPQVMINRDGVVKTLDYETDILTRIDWNNFDHSEVVRKVLFTQSTEGRQLESIHLSDNQKETITHNTIDKLDEFVVFKAEHVVRQINDIILNPFVSWALLEPIVNELKERGFDDLSLGFKSAILVDALRQELRKEQDKRAEIYFKRAVRDGLIQFKLRADGKNWKMPNEIITSEANQAAQIVDEQGNLMQKSLFERVYQMEMNRAEREVAVYLDGQEALGWWHRNVARRHYGLQGWRKNVIYPDFIFSIAPNGKTQKLVVLETKGDHLGGNEDTNYKRAVMTFLTEKFDWDNSQSIGELQLENNGESVICDLILIDEWKDGRDKYFG